MKVLAADGLSFAVPIDSVAKIIEHFKKSGYVYCFIPNYLLDISQITHGSVVLILTHVVFLIVLCNGKYLCSVEHM